MPRESRAEVGLFHLYTGWDEPNTSISLVVLGSFKGCWVRASRRVCKHCGVKLGRAGKVSSNEGEKKQGINIVALGN